MKATFYVESEEITEQVINVKICHRPDYWSSLEIVFCLEAHRIIFQMPNYIFVKFLEESLPSSLYLHLAALLPTDFAFTSSIVRWARIKIERRSDSRPFSDFHGNLEALITKVQLKRPGRSLVVRGSEDDFFQLYESLMTNIMSIKRVTVWPPEKDLFL